MNGFLTIVLTAAPLAVVYLLSIVYAQARNNKMLQEQLEAASPKKDKDFAYKKGQSKDEINPVDEIFNDPMDNNRNGSFDL